MKIINNIQNLLKNFFLNSFIVLISLILSFYALEIYLLYKSGYSLFKDLNYQTPLEEWQSYPSSYIRTDTLKYISNQNNFVPLSGLSKQKIIVCNEGGFWSRYTSDRYGFNNPDNVWDKTFTDVVIVGDSFTEGACVNEYDTISSNLRKISDLNIINLGRGGTASLSHLALLSEYAPKNIKSIVWIY